MKAEQNRQNKYNALMKAALDEFSEKSFEQASLNMILENAGVTKGAFYYSFKDKHDLYKNILEEIKQNKIKYFSENMDISKLAKFDDVNLYDYLKYLMLIGLRFTKEYPKYEAFSKLFYREDISFRQGFVEDESFDIKSSFTPLIEKAIKDRDIDSFYSDDFAHKVIMFMLTNYVDIIGFGGEEKELEDNLDMFIRFLQFGLGVVDK